MLAILILVPLSCASAPTRDVRRAGTPRPPAESLAAVPEALSDPDCSAAAERGGALHAEAGPTAARFTFPLAHRPPWEWDRAAAGTLEHTWAVQVVDGSRTFSFGYFHFVGPGALPRVGTLGDLLAHGQVDVLEEDPAGGTVMPDLRSALAVTVEGSLIVVTLTGARVMATLFSTRPSSVLFTTSTSSCEIAVRYSTSDEDRP